MTYSIYDSFSTEEAESVGKQFKAKCKWNDGYTYCLSVDKEYVITITPRILPMSPLCSFIGDEGKEGECHLTRFEKISEL